MPGVWQAGYGCPVKFTPIGGSEQTIQVTGHSWEEQVEKIDITHTGTGGVEAWIAGVLRGTGNVKAFLDTTAKYYSTTVGIRPGTFGVFKIYRTASLFFTIPCGVLRVNHVAMVSGGAEYDFDINLNFEASTTSYAYPV